MMVHGVFPSVNSKDIASTVTKLPEEEVMRLIKNKDALIKKVMKQQEGNSVTKKYMTLTFSTIWYFLILLIFYHKNCRLGPP